MGRRRSLRLEREGYATSAGTVNGKWEPARYVLGCGEIIWVGLGVEETMSVIQVGSREFVSPHVEPTMLGK